MNSDWDTPPHGDFARYVEQLTARSAARLAAQAREHPLDAGMAPVSEPLHAMPSGAPPAAALAPPGAQRTPPTLSAVLRQAVEKMAQAAREQQRLQQRQQGRRKR